MTTNQNHMPRSFRVSYQRPGGATDPFGPRAERGDSTVYQDCVVVPAAAGFDAAARLAIAQLPDPSGVLVTGVEQMPAAWDLPGLDDEALTQVLTSGSSPLDPADHAQRPCWDDDEGYLVLLREVVEALRDSGRAQGLHLSLLSDLEAVDAVEVQVYDVATGTYRGSFHEFHEMTQDRTATGWAAVLAVARAVVLIADPLR